jgi:hypothetical protein
MATSGGQPTVGLPPSALLAVGVISNAGSAFEAAAANTAAVVSISGVTGKHTFVSSITVFVGFAAAVVELDCTLTGILGSTITFPVIGATGQNTVVHLPFPTPLRSIGTGPTVALTVPASGAAGPAIAALMAVTFA